MGILGRRRPSNCTCARYLAHMVGTRRQKVPERIAQKEVTRRGAIKDEYTYPRSGWDTKLL